MRLTEKPFFLVEYYPNDTQDIFVESADGRMLKAKGLKISRVVDKDLKELAAVSPQRDGVDLSCLNIEGGCNLVSVSSIDGKNLVWCVMSTTKGSPDNNEFIIGDKWVCSEEEVELLNKTFPEYFDHCRLNNKDFVEANKDDITKNEGFVQIPQE